MALMDIMWVSFRKFDRSGDGIITLKEMYQAQKKGLDMSKREIRQMMAAADASGDSELDFREYFKFMTGEELDSRVTQDIVRAFASLDRNGDGSVSRKELQHARRHGKIEMTRKEADALMDKFGDELSFSQFVELSAGPPAIRKRIVLDDDDLYQLFVMLDADKSGSLSAKEIFNAAYTMGFDESTIADIMQATDANKDGLITFSEFKQLMVRK